MSSFTGGVVLLLGAIVVAGLFILRPITGASWPDKDLGTTALLGIAIVVGMPIFIGINAREHWLDVWDALALAMAVVFCTIKLLSKYVWKK